LTSEATDYSLDAVAAAAASEQAEGRSTAGVGPYRLAARRLRRNRVALAAGAVFLLLVASSLAAPLWSKYVAKRGPNDTGLSHRIEINGKSTEVVGADGVPIGPGFRTKYTLGSDNLGRDVMVRMLYGGRTSLFVGFMSALMCTVFSVILGLWAGYFRGWPDRIISSGFDILWSFPVLLFAIALGTALSIGGLDINIPGTDISILRVSGDSLWIPIFIIGFVYVPYLGRPVRGQVLSLREKEFVEAAVAQGMSSTRIMFSEILPNLTSTLLVFGTLIVANNILTEAALSFLGAGIQPPAASWGNLIGDGADRIVTAPHLSLLPGLAITLTVLSLNVFGDGLRDALDPRAKVRLR
jgi:peptide/nickel transport system permease protein